MTNSTLSFMAKPTILCVDDEIDNVDALERLFRSRYTVLKSTSAQDALTMLDQYPEPISVIITDQRMPVMTGSEFLAATLEKRPDSIRILLTGYTDIQSVIEAVNNGQIYRYINKPWDPIDLMATVDSAAEKFQMTRDLKIKNAELTKAYQELKTLDDAKNQFMILINHELKTPLTTILSFTELLKEGRLNDEQETCVSRIYKSAEKLRTLVDDALLIVSGETNVLRTRIAPFALGDLNLNLSQEILQSMKVKNQTLKVSWVDKKIVADLQLITQVFHRLVHNAVKFGSENTAIEIKTSVEGSHRVRFSIFNYGTGISPSVIDKISKPFFLDEDVMYHSTGMGLGLTVCTSILKAHSSLLKIENASNGVEVSFDLPFL